MAHDFLALDLRFHITGATGPCVVRAVEGSERVSAPFRYVVDFLSRDVDLDNARASEAVLEIADADGRERFVHGVVEELSVCPTLWEDKHLHQAVLIPEPCLLRHRHGYRVFTDLSVPDICREVFTRAGLDEQCFEWRLSAAAAYDARPLCLQYDESEWDFVSRLLEEEGIWYRFDHRADGHTMVFGDDSSIAHPTPLPFDFGHADFLSARAYHLDDERSVVEGRVALNDYDDLRPSRDLRSTASMDSDLDREWYEFPGRYASEATGSRLAQTRLDELRPPLHTLRLATTAIEAVAGNRIVVAGAPAHVPDGFVIASELRISPREEDSVAAETERCAVENVLETIPEDQRFRPPRRTPRPVIRGVQTARVTGPTGQEVWIDEHGRVRVQFHWDREGQLDEHASCWVPVSQGHTTGAIMHPRVGWEVMLEFRDGDPDRPVVTGRVYNPFFPPPHALPEQKTLTAHRSDSLPGRERINEVRFEDRAGEEHIAVTAGHDLREVVVVNRHVTVEHDENREVGADRTEVIGVLQQHIGRANHSDSVARGQNILVGKDRVVDVRQSVSQQIRNDLQYDVGNLSFLQVGDGVSGALQSALTRSSDGPAHVLMDSLAPLLIQAQAAVGDESAEAGRAKALFEEEEPEPSYALGPVMGGLTQPPDAPTQRSTDQSSSPSAGALETAGGELGEAPMGTIHAAGDVVEGAHELADGVNTLGEAIEGAHGMADRLGAAEDALDQACGPLDAGHPIDDSALSPEGGLEEVAGFLGDLGDTNREVRRAGDQVQDATKTAGEAASLAEGAAEVVNDPDARAALSLIRTVAGRRAAESNGGRELAGPSSHAPFGNDPLAFLDDLMGASGTRSLWDVGEAISGSIDSAAAGIAGLVGASTGVLANRTDAMLTSFEHDSVHFAAAAADAIIQAALSDDLPAEQEEDDDADTESTEAPEEPTSREVRDQSQSSHDESSEPESQDALEADDEAAHQPRGEGTWSFTVGGVTQERIAGVSVVGSGEELRVGVGGRARDIARLARIEQVGDHRSEVTDGAKRESTGRYVVVTSEGLAMSTNGTGRFVVSGDATVAVGGGHTLQATGDAQVAGRRVQIDAAETVTFECGSARVSISSDGIAIEGTEIVVHGDKIGVDSPCLG